MRLHRPLMLLSVSAVVAMAELQYVSPSSDCPSYQALGQAVFCCSGACKDGTRIGDPGLCAGFDNFCLDFTSPPSCNPTSVLTPGVNAWVESGDGSCWIADECQWVKNNWTYSCCACPTGYIAIPHACGTSLPTNPCVGCSAADERLTGSASTGYQCEAATPANARCKLSAAQVTFVQTNEGFCPSLTQSGGCAHTLGYGHDCIAHDCADIKQPMSKKAANALFQSDVPQFIDAVKKLPNAAGLNSNQFAALVDFAFNTGNSMKYLNKFFRQAMLQKDYGQVCTNLATAFTAADGKRPSQGKRNRRSAESNLCKTPTSIMSGC